MSTYNSMIVGLALHRKSIELVELFSEMLMERVRRNGITFVVDGSKDYDCESMLPIIIENYVV